MNPARLRAYLELILVAAIWGVASAVIKFGLSELTPFVFLTYRFFLTILILLPFYLFSKQKSFGGIKNLPLILLISVLVTTLNLGLLFLGTNLTTALDQSILSASSPILVVLGGWLILREHITKREQLGILITILGTIIITIQPLLHPTGEQGNLLGNILIFGSNFAWVGYALLTKKALRQNISPFSLTFASFLVGFITCLPLAFLEIKSFNLIAPIVKITLSAHLAVLYMAALSGGLAYYLYTKAQKTIETSEASLFIYLQPIFTAPVAYFWLGEKFTLIFILGSIVIALGVTLAEIKKKRYNSSSV
jgi:drug/metabolite transporter (DMT)-like permease